MDTSRVSESVILHLEAAVLKLEHDLNHVKKFLQESEENKVPGSFEVDGKRFKMVSSEAEGFTMTVGGIYPSDEILIATIKGNSCKISMEESHGKAGAMLTRNLDTGEMTMLDHKHTGEVTLVKGNMTTGVISSICKNENTKTTDKNGTDQNEDRMDTEENREELDENEFEEEGITENPYRRDKNPLCLSCHEESCEDLADHPLFEGKLCIKCKECLMETIFWLDDDGCFACCCLCGRGFSNGQIVCSTNSCGRVYCEACLIRLLGGKGKRKIDIQEDWPCFLCSQEPQGRIVPRTGWQENLIKLYEPLAGKTQCPNVTPMWIRTRKQHGLRVLSLSDNIGAVRVALDNLNMNISAYYASEIREPAEEISRANYKIKYLGDMLKITEKQISDILPIDLVVASPPVPKLNDKEEERKLEPLRKVFEILEQIQRENGKGNPLYWLMELPTTISCSIKNEISSTLKVEPVFWNAQCFTPVLLPKFYWGNLPNLSSCLEYYQEHGYKNNLNEFISKNSIKKREAQVTHIRPEALLGMPPEVFDDPHLSKLIMGSRSILEDEELECEDFWKEEDPAHFQLPVTMDGYQSELWIEEMSRLMGFPLHYTDHGSGRGIRLFLLANSSCVHVLKHILRPVVVQNQA